MCFGMLVDVLIVIGNVMCMKRVDYILCVKMVG